MVRLGVEDFAKNSGLAVGLLFLLSSSALIAEFISVILTSIKRWNKRRNLTAFIKYQIQNLSMDEKVALRRFIKEDVSTVHLSLSGGVAAGLEGKKNLTRSSNMAISGSGDHFPFLLQPEAKKIITKNSGLLD